MTAANPRQGIKVIIREDATGSVTISPASEDVRRRIEEHLAMFGEHGAEVFLQEWKGDEWMRKHLSSTEQRQARTQRGVTKILSEEVYGMLRGWDTELVEMKRKRKKNAIPFAQSQSSLGRGFKANNPGPYNVLFAEARKRGVEITPQGQIVLARDRGGRLQAYVFPKGGRAIYHVGGIEKSIPQGATISDLLEIHAASMAPAYRNPGRKTSSPVPPLAKWNMTAGGTQAPDGVNGYNVRIGNAELSIWPYTIRGRTMSKANTRYIASVWNAPGLPHHHRIGEHYRSPTEAFRAHRDWWAQRQSNPGRAPERSAASAAACATGMRAHTKSRRRIEKVCGKGAPHTHTASTRFSQMGVDARVRRLKK